jgi:hypothetical protein
MSQHDGRLYNYLEQIVNLLKAYSRRIEPKTPPNEADKTNKADRLKWVPVLISLGALTVSWLSYSTASDALRISNRAYVSVGNVDIYCPLCDHPDQIRPPKNPPEVTAFFLIDIINYGKTPASIIDMNFSRHAEYGRLLPLDFDFVEGSEADIPGSHFVAPDTSHPLQVKLNARAEDMLSARNQVPTTRLPGKSSAEHLYIFGHITYKDVFNKKHVQLVCRQFIGPTGTIPENWSRCPMHDGEDDSYIPKKKSMPPGFALPEYNAPEPPDDVPPGLRQAPLQK